MWLLSKAYNVGLRSLVFALQTSCQVACWGNWNDAVWGLSMKVATYLSVQLFSSASNVHDNMSIRYFDAWLWAVWPCFNRCGRAASAQDAWKSHPWRPADASVLSSKRTVKTPLISCVRSMKSANLWPNAAVMFTVFVCLTCISVWSHRF